MPGQAGSAVAFGTAWSDLQRQLLAYYFCFQAGLQPLYEGVHKGCIFYTARAVSILAKAVCKSTWRLKLALNAAFKAGYGCLLCFTKPVVKLLLEIQPAVELAGLCPSLGSAPESNFGYGQACGIIPPVKGGCLMQVTKPCIWILCAIELVNGADCQWAGG